MICLKCKGPMEEGTVVCPKCGAVHEANLPTGTLDVSLLLDADFPLPASEKEDRESSAAVSQKPSDLDRDSSGVKNHERKADENPAQPNPKPEEELLDDALLLDEDSLIELDALANLEGENSSQELLFNSEGQLPTGTLNPLAFEEGDAVSLSKLSEPKPSQDKQPPAPSSDKPQGVDAEASESKAKEAKSPLHLGEMQAAGDHSSTMKSDVDSGPDYQATLMAGATNSINPDLETPSLGSYAPTILSGSEAPPSSSSDEKVDIKSGSADRATTPRINSDGSPAENVEEDSVFSRIGTRHVADAGTGSAGKHADGFVQKPEESKANVDYLLQVEVKSGGMGVVYGATQVAVNREVAIKSIRKDRLKSSSVRNQFFHEAKITAILDHPNIPPVYEFGKTPEGTPFYSMKLIKGANWLEALPLQDRAKRLEVFEKVADAVAFAHSKGIIHRDIKPENIVCGTYGEVYLADWGTAVQLNEDTQKVFGGTPEYMPPEAADLDTAHQNIGLTTDIYSLGATLYHLLTNHKPRVDGREQAVRLQRAANNEILPTDIQDPLLDIALKAMSTRPQDRYQTVADLQTAMKDVEQFTNSIELSNRAKYLSEAAINGKDYEQFNRSLFGFSEALEIWPQNRAARLGLEQTRFAYAQCAFDNGDYDLAMQNLDVSRAEDATLYRQAERAKQGVQQRERRFRTLRNLFAGSMAVATVLLTVAFLWVFQANIDLNEQKKLAKNAEKAALDEKAKAKAEEANAREQKEKADVQRVVAESQRMLAEFSEQDARNATVIAEQERITAEGARNVAGLREKEARKNEQIARTEKERADEARLAAKSRLYQIQITETQSNVGLAKLQLDQRNSLGAAELLKAARTPKDFDPQKLIPRMEHWGMKRVELLSNQPMAEQVVSIDGKVIDIAFATQANRGLLATQDASGLSKLWLTENRAGRLVQSPSPQSLRGMIRAIALSPTGDQALIALEEADGKGKLLNWRLGDPTPVPVETTAGPQGRLFQGLGFSPDGSIALAGINGGIWLSRSSQAWQENKKIRGELISLAWLDNDAVVLLTRLNNQLELKLVSRIAGDSIIQVVDGVDAEGLSSIGALGKQHLLLGDRAGGLTLYDLQVGERKATLRALQSLERKHATAVQQIRWSESQRRLLTLGEEPVAHVWRFDDSKEIGYETFVTGVPVPGSSSNNLSKVCFTHQDAEIVLVDASAHAYGINILRQIQRRALTPDRDYASPVIGIASRGITDESIAIHEDGVVDLWNVQTGKSVPLNQERFSYFGHTPGATLVDTAVDSDLGMVITSADLSSAERRYLGDSNSNREFCVWNRATGQMVRRWTEQGSRAREPRLSVVGPGMLLIADETLHVVDYRTGASSRYLKSPASDAATQVPVFAVANPQDPTVIAAVGLKRTSGLLWAWVGGKEGGQASESVSTGNLEIGLPLKGVWAPNGKRFYLAYTTGKVTYFNWEQGKLTQQRDAVIDTKIAQLFTSQHRFDLAVDSNNLRDRLYVNLRSGSGISDGKTTLKVYDIDAKGDVQENTELGMEVADTLWLNEKTHRPSRELTDRFAMNSNARSNVISASRVGDSVLVSTRSGKVFELSDQVLMPKVLGREKLVAWTANRAGTELLTLHADGSLWKLVIGEGVSSWVRQEGFHWNGDLSGKPKLSLSPDNKFLSVWESNQTAITLFETKNWQKVKDYSSVQQFTWSPDEDATLAMIHADGSIAIAKNLGDSQNLDFGVQIPEGQVVKSLQYFNEPSSEGQLTRHYLLVHTDDPNVRSGGQSVLHFVPLDAPRLVRDPASELAEEGQDVPGKPEELKVFEFKNFVGGTRVVASPVDSLLASSDATGTIRIWFASPSYQQISPIFDMESVRDAEIIDMRFTNDGNSLVASDSKRRLTGWMATDKLVPSKE